MYGKVVFPLYFEEGKQMKLVTVSNKKREGRLLDRGVRKVMGIIGHQEYYEIIIRTSFPSKEKRKEYIAIRFMNSLIIVVMVILSYSITHFYSLRNRMEVFVIFCDINA